MRVPLASIALLLGGWLAPKIGWDAPPECPDATTAQATLDRLLDDSPAPEEDPNAKIRITQNNDRFLATVTLGTSSDRELEGTDCNQLAEAAILLVAIAIDPRLGSTDPAPIDVPAPEPEPPADPEPIPDPSTLPLPLPLPIPTTIRETARPTETPKTRSTRRPKALLRASTGIGLGGPPIVTAVIAIGLAAQWQRARLELDGDLWTPRTLDLPSDDGVGVRMIGWTIGLRGCGSPIARRFELPLCAGIRTGALRGAGTGPITPSPKSSIWVTATAGLGAWGWIRPRFALALDVEAVIALTYPRFRVAPYVVQAPPAGLRAIFGPVVRLP